MKNRKRTFRVLAVVATLAAFATMTKVHVRAGDPAKFRDFTRFGILGITGDQTARLNVVVVPADPLTPSDPLKPVQVKLMFADDSGNTINPFPGCTESPSQMTATLDSGHSAHFELNGSQLGLSPVQRIQFRPVVLLPSDPLKPEFSIISTLEVMDNNTSRSLFVYAPADPLRQ